MFVSQAEEPDQTRERLTRRGRRPAPSSWIRRARTRSALAEPAARVQHRKPGLTSPRPRRRSGATPRSKRVQPPPRPARLGQVLVAFFAGGPCPCNRQDGLGRTCRTGGEGWTCPGTHAHTHNGFTGCRSQVKRLPSRRGAAADGSHFHRLDPACGPAVRATTAKRRWRHLTSCRLQGSREGRGGARNGAGPGGRGG